jgi:hypothetical protein
MTPFPLVTLRRSQPLILPEVLEETSKQGLTSTDLANRNQAFSACLDWREKLIKPQFANMNDISCQTTD